MSDYLMEREKDVLLDPETRRCQFADGSTVWVTLFVLTWRWYDRLVAYFKDDPYVLLELADKARVQNNVAFDDALSNIVEHMVFMCDNDGTDLFEDDALLELRIAQERTQAFHARNKGDGGDGAT